MAFSVFNTDEMVNCMEGPEGMYGGGVRGGGGGPDLDIQYKMNITFIKKKLFSPSFSYR